MKLVLGIKLKICTEYQGKHGLTNHLFFGSYVTNSLMPALRRGDIYFVPGSGEMGGGGAINFLYAKHLSPLQICIPDV